MPLLTHTHLPHYIRRPTIVHPDGTTAGGAAQIGYRYGPCDARGRRHMQGHTASDYGADQVSVRRKTVRKKACSTGLAPLDLFH